MEANQISTANILDIIFDGKNKDYGAYQLRKHYDKRMLIALATTFLFAILLSVIAGNIHNDTPSAIQINPQAPVSANPEFQKKKQKIASANKNIKQPVTQPKELIPLILKNNLVENDWVESELTPGNDHQQSQGTADPGIFTAKVLPVIVEPAVAQNIPEKLITLVDVQASFPGGEAGWIRYVKRAIEANLEDLTEEGQSLSVRIRFIVDSEGNVSNVEAIGNMQNSILAKIAEDAIRKGPKWIPAQQNGQYVKAYREQPVTFKLD